MTTLWSVVLRASNLSSRESDMAMERLCRSYWFPLYSYVRRQGRDHHEAEDLTQAFFSSLLASKALDTVHPDKGRFRSFLLASLRHFMANERKHSQRQKRGGGVVHLTLQEDDSEGRYSNEPVDHLTPEKVFERRWAETLLGRVLDRLQAEWEENACDFSFEDLKPFLLGGDPDGTFASRAIRLNVSEASLKWTVHKLRQRYRTIFREEIAYTVARREDIDDEIRHLFTVMAD